MGLFDNIKNKANDAAKNITGAGGNRTVEVRFDRLPENLEQFKSLPQASLSTPFDSAAMTILALCFYPEDKDLSLSMIQYLKGPSELTGMERQFIADRFRDQDYVPRSYFEGAVPGNDYLPSEPYTIKVSEDPYTYSNEGYAKVNIRSGGADSPRQITLRKAKDGKWYLWEQYVLVGIRKPESENPWA
jgi:hypothetical protein